MKINPNDQFPLFAEEFGQSAASINYFLRRFLGDSIASIPGGSVIDVGSGDGLLSLYSALLGARQVTSIEPETAGSTGGILQTYELHRKSLGDANCELVETDFLKLPADRKYDVLLSNDSVNHIREVDGDIR
ncbi:class I SAM-dependent methyltransferase, partial [Pseudomonadales bacterium]|nr:class I SAM-dependent methyltransferase [Pseudomonadales bacterium]